MRLRAVLCILLACIATSMATDDQNRPKRDLQYLKDLITTKLLGSGPTTLSEVPVRGDENFRLFRIPGHDNILVKAVPKVNVIEAVAPVPEKVIEVNPTIGVVESYLGTKNAGETLNALQGVRNLLQSGILNGRQAIEVLPPVNQVYFVPPYMSGAVEILHPKPVVAAPQPPRVPLIPVLPPPGYPPVPGIPEIVPQLIPVPTVQGLHNYSYKQLKDDGSMMTYSANNNGNVIVTETRKPMPQPPPYIIDRFQNIFYELPLGMRPYPMHPPLPPIPAAVEVPKVKVNVNPYSYKQSYMGPGIVREPRPGVLVQEPTIMPAPPTYIVEKIEDVAVKGIAAPKLQKTHSGYSFKLVNNGGFMNPDKKISSSSGSRVIQDSVLLAEPPSPPRYVYKYIHNHSPNNFNVVNRRFFEPNGIPVPCNNHKIEPTSGVGAYSYQQINNGKLITYPEFNVLKTNKPSVLVSESIQMMPTPPLHVVDRIEKVAATAHATIQPKISSGYSYKLTRNGSVINNGEIGTTLFNVGTVNAKKSGGSSESGMYSYKQVTNDGGLTTYVGTVGETNTNSPVLITETSKVMPIPPPHIVQRIENVAATAHASEATKTSSGYSYALVNGSPKQPEEPRKETNNSQGTVFFAEPMSSSYVYKQINHNNPQPFTIVPVGNNQGFARGDYKINSNDNVQMNQNSGSVADVPSEYVYVPPATDDVPLPTRHNEKPKPNTNAQFSYKHVTDNGVYEYTNKDGSAEINSGTSSIPTEGTKVYSTERQTTTAASSLSSNPIVVPESNYTYKQTNADGSSISVNANSENLISVEVTDNEKKNMNLERLRGDIPEISL